MENLSTPCSDAPVAVQDIPVTPGAPDAPDAPLHTIPRHAGESLENYARRVKTAVKRAIAYHDHGEILDDYSTEIAASLKTCGPLFWAAPPRVTYRHDKIMVTIPNLDSEAATDNYIDVLASTFSDIRVSVIERMILTREATPSS